MYENVRVELARKNMTLAELLDAVNDVLTEYGERPMRYQTLSEKMRGNFPLLFREAVAIKKALDVDMPLEELFSKKVTA